MRDHDPIPVNSFKGTFAHGEDDTVPLGYFLSSQNLQFFKGGVKTRAGTSSANTIASVKRIAVYKRIGEAQRLLILDGSGNLYDSTDLLTPILSIAAMSDFSMANIFDRAYITPHDGVTGLPGESVYVYDGAGTARLAGGNPPSSFTLVAADSASSGSVEAGTHAFAVCFETDTGFITKPGGFVSLDALGGRKVDLSNIITGGSSVVARVLLATKRITNFNGDFANQTYFKIPNGRIDDNSSTSYTVDFFDADLQDDASELLEQLSTIPAGVGIRAFQGRMIVWGEDLNSSIVRVSAIGEPESINEVDGFVTVYPGDAGGGLKNCWEYRGQLIMQKSQRTYATQDNDNAPATWHVPQAIDASIGTEPHGLASSLDFGENVQDIVLIADRTGVRLFAGTFPQAGNLTHNIQDIWDTITPTHFHKVEITIDPKNFSIYVAVPLNGATSPNVILYGDYHEGLSIEEIKWTTWTFPSSPVAIALDVVNGIPVLKFGTSSGNVYKMDSSSLVDYGPTAIDSYAEFPLFPTNTKEDLINHFTGVRLRVTGAGSLKVTGHSLDSIITFSAPSITLSTTPGIFKKSEFDLITEKCSVKLRVNGSSEHFTLTKFILYYLPLWQDRG